MSNKNRLRGKQLKARKAMREIPTPADQPSMSAVIVQLAEPLLRQHASNARRAEAIIALAVAAWNKSMLPHDKQPVIDKEIVDSLVPQDGNAEDVGLVMQVMETIAARREALFPDLRKVIVSYELSITEGNLNLNVSSAAIP